MGKIVLIYLIMGFVVALSLRNRLNTKLISIDFLFLVAIWPVFMIKGID